MIQGLILSQHAKSRRWKYIYDRLVKRIIGIFCPEIIDFLDMNARICMYVCIFCMYMYSYLQAFIVYVLVCSCVSMRVCFCMWVEYVTMCMSMHVRMNACV